MNLKHFISQMPPSQRDGFAKKCGTSKGHLQNVMYGSVPLAPIVCVAVERESFGVVTRKDLRPDDWEKIWPELAEATVNHAQAATESVAQGL
jgi:DNA-binding transcriptional regulator YdaS (Cro superfamily)